MSTPSQAEVRRMIAAAGTIVVKVGSSSLTQPSGHLDPDKLDALAAALAQVRLMGGRVVLVSSGAIAAGFGPLGFDSRPVDVATQQATAAVGQGLLMARYETAFGRFGIRVGQILITAEDTIRATQYRNVERTLDRLLDLGVVPIINENDSLASNEIRFGDNDRLSALVANLVRAEALVLLTDVDALYTAPPSQPGSRRVEYVPNVIDALGDIQVSGSGSKVGTGGMVTKLEAARVAAVSGIPTVLTCASNAGPAMMGDPVGTVFAPVKARGSSRRLWIGFAADPRGTIDMAELFKVFGDSTRIKILCCLFDGERFVQELADRVGASQSAISHQLRLLKQAKLVKNRRQGKLVGYSLADDHVKTILGMAKEHLEEEP